MKMWPAKLNCWRAGVNIHTVIIVDDDIVHTQPNLFVTSEAAKLFAEEWNGKLKRERLQQLAENAREAAWSTALDRARMDAYVNRNTEE